MLKISDLVRMDTQGTFRSDVQLSDYDNEILNMELLGHYIFTTKAPETHSSVMMRRVSALDVLETLRSAFMLDRVENRMTIVANYGHGKSHLALTLANYFSKPASSDETKSVLQRLKQALDSPARLTGYQQFKESKGEFLVVRLRGDSPVSLREQFLKGLENALQEHTATQGVQLPFWYKKAEESLKNLSQSDRKKANEYLKEFETDVAALLANLQQDGARGRCREVFRAVYGFAPDFGDEISLKEAVIWTVDQFCGLGKPLGGLLILFDEFSLFIQRYARSGPNGDLQDLLNGISDRQGRSAFVAFSQHDPRTVAENSAMGQALESLIHELTRLPPTKAFALYSLMESVIHSYLKQPDKKWDEWSQDQKIRPYFAQAREVTLQHFSRRYNSELQWSLDDFSRIVVKGCYPLHPLTAAILSTHKFQAGEDIGTARTALGFVQKQMDEKKDQPAIEEDRPNLTPPIALVDYFEERLSKEAYEGYQAAAESAAERLSDIHHKALKALFLQTASRIQARAGDQIELLAHMSGLTPAETKKALNELGQWNAILVDRVQNISSFWPSRVQPKILEDAVKQAMEGVSVDQSLLDELGKLISPLQVQTSFGNSQDWAATQKILTAQFFTSTQIKAYGRTFRIGVNGIEDGDRSAVIWLVAKNDEEKLSLRQQAEQILDQANAGLEYPLPVIVMLPQKPIPEIIEAFRRLKAIKGLSQTERQKIGEHAYEQEKQRSEAIVQSKIAELQGGIEQYQDVLRAAHELAVPAPYRTAVKALKHLSLKDAMRECYRLAYQRPEFYEQYQVAGRGQNKLRDAVKKVSLWLFEDEVGTGIRTLSQNDIQKQLCEKYLFEKWGLLTAGTYAIQEPLQRSLRESWDYLEMAFPPGCQDCSVRQTFVDLLNPPFGHDYHTLVLLFASWAGYNQHELRFTLGGSTVSVQQIKQHFDAFKTPKDFLDSACCSTTPINIGRSKPDEILHEATELDQRIRRDESFTQEEAQDALARLEQALNNPRLPPSQREDVDRDRQRLDHALQVSQEYDQKAQQVIESIQKHDLAALLKQQEIFTSIPQLAQVTSSAPMIDELVNQWEQALENAVMDACEEYGSLRDISEQRAHEQVLQNLHRQLKSSGRSRSDLAKKVEKALEHLSQDANDLRRAESEKAVIAEINGMTASASLKDLYMYRQRLDELDDLSKQTEAIREKQRRLITERISQFETLGKELPLAIDNATSVDELDEQRTLLLRNLDHVEGTDFHPTLVEADRKIGKLRAFFDDVKGIDNIPLDNPHAAETASQKIKGLQKHYESVLGHSQEEMIRQAELNLHRRVKQLAQEAHQWLESVQKKIGRDESPEALLKALDTPHSFLSKDALKQISVLKSQAQEKLEQDILAHIVVLFQKIHDPKMRQECLSRLQKIMEHDDR